MRINFQANFRWWLFRPMLTLAFVWIIGLEKVVLYADEPATLPNSIEAASELQFSAPQNLEILSASQAKVDHGFVEHESQQATNSECDCSVWEVSCRHLGCLDSPHELAVTQYVGASWQRKSQAQLIEELGDGSARTVFYVHGNRTSQAEARQRVMRLACALRCRQAGLPIRLVLYSWPSEKPDGILPRKLIEDKKSVIDGSSIQLAGLLTQASDQEFGIVGFSFGCAVTSGALHLLSGGNLSGCTVSANSTCECTRKFRIGFIAPAFERDALTQCGKYSLCLSQVDLLVNLYNSRDPILQRFRFFDRANPDAAGLLGLTTLVPTNPSQPLVASNGIIQFDCQNIGRTHAENDYYGCNRLNVMLDAVLGNAIVR